MTIYFPSIRLSFFILLLFIKPALSSTTIEMWTTQTQSDRMKTIRLILDTFEVLNPGISVNLVPVDENQMSSQMAAASAAGTLPQIFEGNSALMLAFGEAGIIDPMRATAVIAKIGEARFYTGALNLLKTPKSKGYFAVPFHGWIQGIWYRKDWFAEAGLPPPNTWENILKAAKSFHKPQQNQYGILMGTQADTYAEQCFTHLALSNNGAEFDEKGDLVFNSKQIREALEFYKTLTRYGPPGPQTWRARDYYLQGKLAMFFYSTYIMDDLVSADTGIKALSTKKSLAGLALNQGLAEKTHAVTIISHTQPAGFGSVVCLALGKTDDAEKAVAAEKLMAFLYDPLSYITFLHISPGGMNPMLRDIADKPEYLQDPVGVFKHYGQENIRQIVSGFDHMGSFTVVNGKAFPASGKIYAKQIIPRMIYSVAFEEMAVDDAVLWAEKEMKKVIEKK